VFFFFSSRRRHTSFSRDWSSDVCSSDLAQGVVFIDGVPTKHYLETELEVLFNGIDLSIDTIDRLEYDWSTEFDSPPTWMGEPYQIGRASCREGGSREVVGRAGRTGRAAR